MTSPAVIVVAPTPYIAVTAKTGLFSLNVEPGQYRMHVFHERSSAVTLEAGCMTMSP